MNFQIGQRVETEVGVSYLKAIETIDGLTWLLVTTETAEGRRWDKYLAPWTCRPIED